MSSASLFRAANPCDFGLVYNDQFKYCVPEPTVRNFYIGAAFDRKEAHSKNEQDRLDQDIQNIYSMILSQNPASEKTIVITAGAPGAGKTWLMRSLLEKEKASGKVSAYIDPDDVCLKSMALTWRADVEKLSGLDLKEEKAGRKKAYDQWRPGSNAANHLILANLIREGKSIYFGTTSSSPFMKGTFSYLKNQGYHIKLVHLVTPDSVRCDSIVKRDQQFIQTTEEDITNKGLMVPQRIHDYLQGVDAIDFFFRGAVDQEATFAATWVRKDRPIDPDGKTGDLTILDQTVYNQMVRTHDEICGRIDDGNSLLWENSVERVSHIFESAAP